MDPLPAKTSRVIDDVNAIRGKSIERSFYFRFRRDGRGGNTVEIRNRRIRRRRRAVKTPRGRGDGVVRWRVRSGLRLS
jgi:hypothetical protein